MGSHPQDQQAQQQSQQYAGNWGAQMPTSTHTPVTQWGLGGQPSTTHTPPIQYPQMPQQPQAPTPRFPVINGKLG